MTDIVERLRSPEAVLDGELPFEAADEIERLKAQMVIDWINHGEEIERLTAALQEIADLRYDNTSAATIARRALEPKP